ncbi:phosphatase [Anopheles sinensis]|uniref:Phosphatase n=1 Tax=Anopheles sinensis TaxID=74873 RepID=A0A084WPK9_ANOSI|nr:phosphatase [Anopheles sinensis]
MSSHSGRLSSAIAALRWSGEIHGDSHCVEAFITTARQNRAAIAGVRNFTTKPDVPPLSYGSAGKPSGHS